jgi:hypothetical protein
LGMRSDQGRRRGIGEIGPMVTRQGPRRYGKRAIDCVSPGVGTDSVAVSRLGGARHDGPARGRAGRAPTQWDGAPTSCSRVGSQTDMTRCRMLHDLFARERPEMESVTGLSTAHNSGGSPHDGVRRSKYPPKSVPAY